MRIPATWPAAPRPAIESAITAQAIADLLRAYPDLAGVALVLNPYDDIAAGPGETGKASAPQTRPAAHAARGEWLLDVARALAANGGRAATGEPQGPPGRSARGQELLVGVRDEPPELLARLMTIYPHVRLLHDFQERSWTSPQVDPRAARLGVEVASAGGPGPRAPVSGIAVGGPGCANRYLFWGDPAWMREVSLDLRRQGLDGMFLRPESEDPWLAVEAWGVYAFQSGDVFNQKRWQKRLEEVYGVGMYAGQLLEAARHASAIMPRLCSLVNGCSERYMPQLGLPLACSVGLPAATGARLRQPAAAATRPSAEGPVLPGQTPIASIPEEVNLQAPPGATGAEAIARAIGSDVAVCRSRLTGLRHVKPELPQQAAELGRLLDRIELNAALGEHYAHWIRAGLAWERYRTLRGPEGAYIADFQKAIEAWTALTAVANRLYPDPVPSWELRIASPPPWTREQIRRSYHPVYRHWRDHLGALDREMGWLRDQQGTDRPDSISLAAWDYLHALPPARLQGVSRITFTGINDRRYHLGAGGGPVDQEGISIRGPSLLLNTRGLGGGWHRVFETDPAAMPIPLGRPLEIVFLYRVLQPGTEDPEPFLAGIRKTPQGPILGDAPRWGAPVGHQGIRIIKIPPLQGGPHILTIDVLGEAAIVIDELRLEAMKFEP